MGKTQSCNWDSAEMGWGRILWGLGSTFLFPRDSGMNGHSLWQGPRSRLQHHTITMPSASRRRVTHCGRESLSSATPPNHKAISRATMLHPVQNPLGLPPGLTSSPPLLSSPLLSSPLLSSPHSSLPCYIPLSFSFFCLHSLLLLRPLYLSRLPPAQWWILAVWLVELQSFSHTIFSISCLPASQVVLRPVNVARGRKESTGTGELRLCWHETALQGPGLHSELTVQKAL